MIFDQIGFEQEIAQKPQIHSIDPKTEIPSQLMCMAVVN